LVGLRDFRAKLGVESLAGAPVYAGPSFSCSEGLEFWAEGEGFGRQRGVAHLGTDLRSGLKRVKQTVLHRQQRYWPATRREGPIGVGFR